jgi:tetratricopeptide (TPR) repeat protein
MKRRSQQFETPSAKVIKLDVDALLNEASQKFDEEDYQAAENICTRILAVTPAHLGARLGRAAAWLQQGNEPAAESEYAFILTCYANPSTAHLGYIQSLLMQDKYDTALTSCNQLIQLIAQDQQSLTSADGGLHERNDLMGLDYIKSLDIHSLHIQCLLFRAEVLCEQNNLAEAEEQYQQIYHLENNVDIFLFEAAKKFIQQEKFNIAIMILTLLFELEPDYDAALFSRAECYVKLQQYEAALADYTQLHQLVPERLSVLNRRAYCYFLMADYSQAIADCTRILSQEPAHADTLAGRAGCYYRFGQYEAATADLKQALALMPECQDMQLFLAKSLFRSHQIATALTVLNDLFSTEVPAYLLLEGFHFLSEFKHLPEVRSVMMYIESDHVEQLPAVEQNDFRSLKKRLANQHFQYRLFSKQSREIGTDITILTQDTSDTCTLHR